MTGTDNVVAIPDSLMMSGSDRQPFGIRVQATGNIGVFAMNRIPGSCDGLMALPVSSLGKSYFAMCYYPARLKTQIAIVGSEASTVVTITLPTKHGVNDVLVPGDPNPKFGGQTFTVNVNAYEVVQLQSAGDLTGTRVESDKNIGLISGNVDTHVRLANTDQVDTSHLAEQMLPLDTWGKTYYIVPFPGRAQGDLIRMVVKEASTQVTVDNAAPVIVTDVGDLYSYKMANTVGPIVITSDKDMLLAQFALSQSPASSDKDPAMMVVAPAQQWRPMYTFSTGRSSASGQTHYMLIVIEAARLSLLQHNKVNVDISGWVTFPAPDNAFVGKAVPISPGS